MAKVCTGCGQSGGLLRGLTYASIRGKDFCSNCAERFLKKATDAILITTTNNVDGYLVERYIGIDSVEVVIGTGMFSEFGGDVADFFGTRASGFEMKLQSAKQAAFTKLKLNAFMQGGNAVIGIDIDYTEFTSNRIGVIANGTIVKIVPNEDFRGPGTVEYQDESQVCKSAAPVGQ